MLTTFLSATAADVALLPRAVLLLIVAYFSAVIGSFLTVVAHRLPIMIERQWASEDGEPPQGTYNLAFPHSSCPSCNTALRPWHNVPLLSYALLRGRCGHCGVRISARYPLIEAITVGLGLLAAIRFGWHWHALAAFGLACALFACALIDIQEGLLPDAITLPLLWAGLAVNLLDGFVPIHEAVIGAMAGYGFLWLISQAVKQWKGRDGIGFGDLKLYAAVGAWLGVHAVPQILALSCLFGLLHTVVPSLHESDGEKTIVFGPAIALASAVTLYGGVWNALARVFF
ncbi:prepilin peptidase [Caballeronia sp. EK]|uniref:prepilin peptidase n=1 Tax=Caballeronia sp. EK TaxID=2767469 RepID=UPI0016565351|nr:A24 family peptidase [Caballeronia sp. EK]MBC8641628.1 prepilin peptidase [Caballeronia sp. EK]